MDIVGACNFASNTSNNKYIAFFNSDTELFDDTLAVCFEYMEQNPDVAACGPQQVDSKGRITHAGVFGTNDKPKIRGWRSRRKFNDVRDDCVTVFGSAYFVNRRIWDELQFDEQFQAMFPNIEGAFLPTKHYYEETWFSYFARHRGYKIAYVGTTMMLHEWHQSSEMGSMEGKVMRESRKLFRKACDYVGIDHD